MRKMVLGIWSQGTKKTCSLSECMDTDPLRRFKGLTSCPVCGCLDRPGMYRCAECGTFHAGSIMVERAPPTQEEQRMIESTEIDPSIYSLGPNAAIPEETFDETDDVRSWDGGSTDFSFEDDEPEQTVVKPIVGLIEPEDISAEE